MSQQPTKTDNKSIPNKIFIRQKAIENLSEVNVMDLFAGRNVLWNNIKTNNYYGIDVSVNKGKNLNVDTRKAIDNLDLSSYNVIDCDIVMHLILFNERKKVILESLSHEKIF